MLELDLVDSVRKVQVSRKSITQRAAASSSASSVSALRLNKHTREDIRILRKYWPAQVYRLLSFQVRRLSVFSDRFPLLLLR